MIQDGGFKNFIFSRKGPIIGIWPHESKIKTWVKILSVYVGVFLFFKLSAIILINLIEEFNFSHFDLIWELQGIVVYFISFLILLLVLAIEDKFDYFRELLKLPTRQRPLIIIFLCGFILILDIIISGFFGILTSSGLDDYFVDPNSDSNIIILLLYFINVVIAAPIVEELFFRGYLLDKMRVQHSDIFAIMITGLFFGLIHWSPYWDFWHLSPILFTGIGGVLYAWLRIKTGSIWPSIICHSIWNLFVGVIIFL
jgi:membrane protease YdiL (CAAX protease family)